MDEKPSNSTKTYHISEILKSIGVEKIPNYKPPSETRNGELRLVVQGVVERFKLENGFELVLGREPNKENHFDLSKHDGGNLGVSRWHAMLFVHENKLFIRDLGSTNGTFVSSKRVEPEKPVEISKGDTITLGKMNMQVLFRLPS